MLVALVSPYRLSIPGGVQGQVVGLEKALRAAGAEIVVVSPGIEEDRSQLTEIDNLCLVGRTLAVPVNGSRAPVAPTPQAMARTRRALHEIAPDIVHVHEPFVPGPALAASLYPRAPVLATFHRADAGRGYRLLGPSLRRIYARIDEAVAVSLAAKATLRSVIGVAADRCGLLANAVDLGRFENAKPASSDAPTIVFVGRHEQRKGLGVLLEAFGHLGPDLHLWVVGSGPQTNTLRERYGHNDRISWLGTLRDDALAARFAGADLFVAPALAGESFGVVLLEAMAAGTAVLASDLPGYRLAAGEDVEYVAPGDARALAARIGELLEDAKRRGELVAAGKRRVGGYSFVDLAARYLDRYEAVLAVSPRRDSGR